MLRDKFVHGCASASRKDLDHAAVARQAAAGEKRIVRWKRSRRRQVVRRVAVGSRPATCDRLGGPGEQAGPRDVVPGNVPANFVERRFRRAQADGLAQAVLRQLVRQDAQNVEVRARPHAVAALAHELNFAGGVGHGAVFFVGRKRRQNDIGQLRGFGKEQVLHDEQIEFAEALGGRPGRMFSRDSRRPRRAL